MYSLRVSKSSDREEFVLPNAMPSSSNTVQPAEASSGHVPHSVTIIEESEEASTTEKAIMSRKVCRFFMSAWNSLKHLFIRYWGNNTVLPIMPPVVRPNDASTSPEKADSSPADSRLETTNVPDEPKLKTGTIPSDPLIKTAAYPVAPANSEPKAGSSVGNRTETDTDTKPTGFSPKAGPMTRAVKNTQRKTDQLASLKMKSDAIPKWKTDVDMAPIWTYAAFRAQMKAEAKRMPPEFHGSRTLESVFDDYYYYDSSKLLGSGSYGKVYEGFRKSDGKRVAVKIAEPQYTDKYITMPGSSSPSFPLEVAMMIVLQESQICPNVIQMYDWCKNSNYLMIVMEHPKPCMTLTSFIRSRFCLDEKTARPLFQQAVKAVKHCLEHGVLHIDLHPSNFLVNIETLELKLIDFGVCQLVQESGHLSRDYLGAPSYRPPEVYKKPRYYAMPTSVWLLGSVLYEMVLGFQPFPETPPCAKNFCITNLPERLADLIKRCLCMSPVKRPTIQEILDDPWLKDE